MWGCTKGTLGGQAEGRRRHAYNVIGEVVDEVIDIVVRVAVVAVLVPWRGLGLGLCGRFRLGRALGLGLRHNLGLG